MEMLNGLGIGGGRISRGWLAIAVLSQLSPKNFGGLRLEARLKKLGILLNPFSGNHRKALLCACHRHVPN
jgi:hypothetical protein